MKKVLNYSQFVTIVESYKYAKCRNKYINKVLGIKSDSAITPMAIAKIVSVVIDLKKRQ